MIYSITKYKCDLSTIRKLTKEKVYKCIITKDKTNYISRLYKVDNTYELSIIVNYKHNDKSYEYSVQIDMTTENNKQVKNLRRFMNKWFDNYNVKVDIDIVHFAFSNQPIIIGNELKLTVRDSITNEQIMKPKVFTFWNTKSNPLIKDITLVDFIHDKTQVKYPKSYTIKKWIDKLNNENVDLYRCIGEVLKKFLMVINIKQNYPTSLKRELVNYFIEEVKYAYMLTYHKWPTDKTPYDKYDMDRNLFLIIYRLLTSYQPKGKFSYAMFYSKCVLDHKWVIKKIRYLVNTNYQFYYSIKEIYNKTYFKNIKSRSNIKNKKLDKYNTNEKVAADLKKNIGAYNVFLTYIHNEKISENMLNNTQKEFKDILKYYLNILVKKNYVNMNPKIIDVYGDKYRLNDIINNCIIYEITPYDLDLISDLLLNIVPNKNISENLTL